MPHFSRASVGEPTIIKEIPSEVANQTVDTGELNTTEKIGKAAKLTSEQMNELINLENSTKFKSQAKGGREVEIGKVKVLVPTYIPEGFRITYFSRISLQDDNLKLINASYRIGLYTINTHRPVVGRF